MFIKNALVSLFLLIATLPTYAQSPASDGSPNTATRSGIYTMDDLRRVAAKAGVTGSDEFLIRDYASRSGRTPEYVAEYLGVDLGKLHAEAQTSTDRFTEKFIGGAVLGGLVTLIAGAVVLARRFGKRGKAAVMNAIKPHAGEDNDRYFVAALDELDHGRLDRATWARALASSNGDDGKAKADYIKHRVAQLADAADPGVKTSTNS